MMRVLQSPAFGTSGVTGKGNHVYRKHLACALDSQAQILFRRAGHIPDPETAALLRDEAKRIKKEAARL